MKTPSLPPRSNRSGRAAFGVALLGLVLTLPLLAAEKAVLVPVEAGIHQVRVETWDAVNARWERYAVAHLDGSPGTVKVRVPAELSVGQYRVRASTQALIPSAWLADGKQVRSSETWETDGTAYPGSRAVGPDVFASEDAVVSGGGATVEESDIWRVVDDTLYFFNRRRGLQVFDLSDPAAPERVDTYRLPARGEQMYVRPDAFIALLTHRRDGVGVELVVPGPNGLSAGAFIPTLDGHLVESRLVGDRLYLVCQDYHRNEEGEWQNVLRVEGIDLSDPASPVRLTPLEIELDYGWGNVVAATPDTLMLSVQRQLYEASDGEWWRRGWRRVGEVFLVDLTAGAPVLTHRLETSGAISDKFKLQLEDGILTTISEASGRSGNADGWSWFRTTVVETFAVSGERPVRLDVLEVAPRETLFATRFAGDRVYVVTFLRKDPLFVIDLSTPSDLAILGQLDVPGYSSYLQPLAQDRLLSVGVEDRRVAVSLFDVSDPARLLLTDRVYLGDEGSYSWSEGNYDEKAISVLPESGLVMLPFQSYGGSGESYEVTRAMQLIDLDEAGLSLRGTLEGAALARRATLLPAGGVVSVANEELLTADLSDRDDPSLLAQVSIAWTTDEVFLAGDYLLQLESFSYDPMTGESRPRLRVSPRDQPDALLHELPLAAGRLVGTSFHQNRLHLLYAEVLPADQTERESAATRYQQFQYDFTDPLNPTLLGSDQIEIASESNGYHYPASMRADWDGDLLYWWSEENNDYGYLALDYMRGAGFGFAEDVVADFFFWGPRDATVLTARVTGAAAPDLLDGLRLSANLQDGWSSFGHFWRNGDELFVVQKSEWWIFHEPTGEKIMGRYENHRATELLTVSLADPTALELRDRQEILGQLQGLYDLGGGGSVLFTVETGHLEVTDGWRQSITTRAYLYDGAQVLLLDTLRETLEAGDYVASERVAFIERQLFRARTGWSEAGGASGAVDRVYFGAGKLETLPPLELDQPEWIQLQTQTPQLLVFNAFDTRIWTIEGAAATLEATLPPKTQSAWYWGWGQSGEVRLVMGEALWIPVGAYGVDYFPLPPATTPHRSLVWQNHAADASDWKTIPDAALTEVSLDTADAVGRMDHLAWRFRRSDWRALDAAAEDLGDYQYRSAWFGAYEHPGDSSWLRSEDHGWLYSHTTDEGSWLYDTRLGWSWTRDAVYPFIYDYAGSRWLYYHTTDSTGLRWCYDLRSRTWVTIARSG